MKLSSQDLSRSNRVALVASVLITLVPCASAWAADSFTATYRGRGSNSTTCSATFNIQGQEPSAAGAYPVFVYMVGTSETFTNAAATAAVAGMANRGYVAATVQYSNGQFGNCSQISGKARCIFDPASATSAISTLCSRAKADCNKGIVVGGFSQGAVMATLARNFDARVEAAWGMGDGITYAGIFNLSSCVADGNRALTEDRLRAVDGQVDDFLGRNANSVRNQLQTLTGVSCAGAFDCLQSDGSGWYIVQNAQVQDGTAEHCYMRRQGGCLGSQNNLDQNWQTGTAPWSLGACLDWLTGFTQH